MLLEVRLGVVVCVWVWVFGGGGGGWWRTFMESLGTSDWSTEHRVSPRGLAVWMAFTSLFSLLKRPYPCSSSRSSACACASKCPSRPHMTGMSGQCCRSAGHIHQGLGSAGVKASRNKNPKRFGPTQEKKKICLSVCRSLFTKGK